MAKGASVIANNEVTLMQSIPKSKFIINLWHAFQNESHAYLLMDYTE